jgi:hypothetical protein
MSDKIKPALKDGIAFCTRSCPRYRLAPVPPLSPHTPEGECSVSNRNESECVPWYRARTAELETLLSDIPGLRRILNRPCKVCAEVRARLAQVVVSSRESEYNTTALRDIAGIYRKFDRTDEGSESKQ